MARVTYTSNNHIIDTGSELWPQRDPPTEQERKLWEAMAMLTERQRDVVELRWYAGWSFAKIGKELDISKQACHAIHNRALELMKGQIGETVSDDS